MPAINRVSYLKSDGAEPISTYDINKNRSDKKIKQNSRTLKNVNEIELGGVVKQQNHIQKHLRVARVLCEPPSTFAVVHGLSDDLSLCLARFLLHQTLTSVCLPVRSTHWRPVNGTSVDEQLLKSKVC